MQSAVPEISACPSCGRALEETSGGGLGCMVCLLRVGIGGEDELGIGISADEGPTETFQGDERFGVYEIDRREDGSLYQLGRGAMGATFRATDTTLQRKVALKIIRIGVAGRSREARDRFLREARAAAALRHENIATVFQFGIREETGQLFYAMELVEGETLEERVRRAGPLDVRTAIDIARQVTSALAAAEKRGLIHRDLKPTNLMLISPNDETVAASTQRGGYNNAIDADQKNEKITVKIIDFGLAKALNAPGDSMRLTHDGFVGTPAFASPEQFDPESVQGALDVRSDIYSLGVTLWFALTGKVAVGGRSVEEIRRAQQSNDLPIEQLKTEHVPRRLRSLLKSMLALEPAARPGTRDLAAGLERCATQAANARRTRAALTAVAIMILSASALFAFHALRTRPATARSTSIPVISQKSIAVLPFENLSRDPDNAYLAGGIQEEILTRLAKIADLKVISRTSTQRFKSAPDDLPQIAKQLGVAHVLEGTVQKAADQVRVTVQLINAENDSSLWSEKYDRKLTDIFAVESEVAANIATVLQAKLTGNERRAIATRPTENAEAHQLYLKGTYFSNKRTGPDLRTSIDYFKGAIGKDPKYALAYAGMADAYALLSLYGGESPQETMPLAKAAARKALELDDNLPEAHNSLGLVLALYDFDFNQSKKEFERAIALNPNYATAHHQFGNVNLAMIGEFDPAIAEANRAVELDPLSLIINADLGQNLMLARRYDEAIDQLRKTLTLDPRFYYARWTLGEALQMKGQLREAMAEYEKAAEITDDPQVMALLAQGDAKTGQRDKALNLLSQLEQLSKHRHVGLFTFALVRLALGENEKAIDDLERAYREHDPNIVGIKVEPLLDPLRSDPRFEKLVEEMRQPVEPELVAKSVPEKSIAVLPFEDLSENKEHTFFADGVQDDVLTKLAKVADLKVISRSSVMQYRGKQDLRRIGSALGVSHVLEGTVRHTGGKVHINAQLIDARTDTHVWAEEYDRELNEVFAIEAELAQSIANHLRANVSARENLAIQERPTDDLIAYDFYVRATSLIDESRYYGLNSETNFFKAVELLNQAIARDRAFFRAYCALAWAHDKLYFTGTDHSPGRLRLAKSAIDSAFRLNPDSGEAHLVSALHFYNGYLDYDKARDELAIALRTMPNDARIFEMSGFIDRRQGRWHDATRNFERAIELDPQNGDLNFAAGFTYFCSRDYKRAKEIADRGLAFSPKKTSTSLYARLLPAWIDFHERADVRPWDAVLAQILAEDPASARDLTRGRFFVSLYERDPAAAERALATLDYPVMGARGIGGVKFSPAYARGLIARMKGDTAGARTAFTAAREQQKKAVAAAPDDASKLCFLGLIDAALGRKQDALGEGRHAVELLPPSKDALSGSEVLYFYAVICVWIGERDLAIQQLETLANLPAGVSYGEIRLDPHWDPLRSDPHFEKIAACLTPKSN